MFGLFCSQFGDHPPFLVPNVLAMFGMFGKSQNICRCCQTVVSSPIHYHLMVYLIYQILVNLSNSYNVRMFGRSGGTKGVNWSGRFRTLGVQCSDCVLGPFPNITYPTPSRRSKNEAFQGLAVLHFTTLQYISRSPTPFRPSHPHHTPHHIPLKFDTRCCSGYNVI